MDYQSWNFDKYQFWVTSRMEGVIMPSPGTLSWKWLVAKVSMNILKDSVSPFLQWIKLSDVLNLIQVVTNIRLTQPNIAHDPLGIRRLITRPKTRLGHISDHLFKHYFDIFLNLLCSHIPLRLNLLIFFSALPSSYRHSSNPLKQRKEELGSELVHLLLNGNSTF